MSGVLALARLPDVRRVETAWCLSVVGWTSSTVAVLVYAYDAGGAVLLAVYSVGRAICGAGAAMAIASLSDLVRRDRLLRLTTGARVALVAGAGMLALLGGNAVVVVLAVVLADGLASIFRPLQAAALPWLVRTPEELASANVAATLMESTGTLVGPLLAGAALWLTGAPTALVLSGGWTLLALASLLALRLPDDSRDASATRRLRRDVAVGSRALVALPPAGGLVVLALVQTVARGALMVGLVVFALGDLGLADASVGWLNAAMGVGGILGGLVGAVVVRSTRLGQTFVAGVVLWGLALLLMAIWPQPAFTFAAMLMIGIGNAHADASVFTLIPRLAGQRLTGRVVGALELLIVVGVGLGSVLAPWLIDTLGARATFGLVGALVVVTSLGYGVPYRRVDRSLPVPAAEVAVLRALPMFAPLPLVAVEQLAASLEREEHPAGRVVIAQGDPGDRFYVVAAGRADVRVDGVARPSLGPGECFGEIALLRDSLRTATVTAGTDLTTYTTDRAAFLRAVSGNRLASAEADALAGERLSRDRTGG